MDYYVSPTGNDGAAGTAPGTAWRTMNKIDTEFAAGTFGPGDNIMFERGQAWQGTIDVRNCSGVSGNPITIGTYSSGARPILDAPVAPSQYIIGRWNGYGAADYIAIEDIEFTAPSATDGSLLRVEDCVGWEFTDLYVHNGRHSGYSIAGIVVRYDGVVTLDDCEISDIAGEGLYVGRANSPAVRGTAICHNCYIHDCWGEGVDLKDGSLSCEFIDCTFYNNAVDPFVGGGGYDTTGIWIGGQSHYFYNCIIEEVGAFGPRGAGESLYAVRLGSYYNVSNWSGRYIVMERCLIKGFTGTAAVYMNCDDNELVNCTIANCDTAIRAGTQFYTPGRSQIIRRCIYYNCAVFITYNPLCEPEYLVEDNEEGFVADFDNMTTFDLVSGSRLTGLGWRPYPGGGTGVRMAVARVACNTATGNQDITSADLCGIAPKAAFFIVTQAITDGVAANHAVLGIGAATATDERWACGIQCEDGVGTTDTNRRSMTNECVIKLNAGDAGVDGEADFVAFIADGVRINWGNAPAAAYLLTVVLFAGTDLTAKADVFQVGPNQNDLVDVNTIGFEPDAVLTATTGDPMADAAGTHARLAHGVFVNKAPIEQYCWAFRSEDNVATSAVSARISDNYGTGQINLAGAWTWAGEFSALDADGFSCTTRLGPGGVDRVGFLALAFGGVVDFEAGIIDSPVANGNQTIADPGFMPQYVHVGLTQLQAINAADVTGLAGSFGISIFDAGDEYCNSVQDEDAQGTSDTQSLSDDTVINLPQDDGVAGWVASFVSFNADGWIWNFSASLGTAAKWWYLAIEEEATLPPPPPPPPPEPIAPPIVRGSGLRSFNYHKRVRTPGGWTMRIGGTDERVDLFELDYQVEFWRRDAAGGLDWYLDFEGFVRSWEFDQDQEGRETFVARGRGYNDLLQAEVIRYAKGSAQANKNGVCETVAKEYVDENIGPGAAVPRRMQGLTIQADVGTGAAWQGDRANKNLLDVLIELAEAAPADFMVVGTGPATFEFQWKTGQWGTDKTRGNAAGIPATVFGSIYGNVTNITYRYSRLNDVNVCYVGGEGTGAARIYVERTSGTEADSPWARRAVFRSDKNEAIVAALEDKGDDELAKQSPKREFSFDARQTVATRYGRDWGLGDLVTVEHRGEDIDQKTVGVYISMSEDGTESIQPELEDT